jgi:hypothetical protein
MRTTSGQKSAYTFSIALLSALVVHVAVGSAAKLTSGWAVEMLKMVLPEMGYACAIQRTIDNFEANKFK